MEPINFNFQPKTYFRKSEQTVLIARMHYPESQWGEELSVFAEYNQGMIYYEVADFYGNTYEVSPEFTAEPLRMDQLIWMIETMEDVTGNSENIDLPRMGIPEATSDYYPELGRYFDEKQRDVRKTS